MSREILFRGKNVDNGVWVEGYLSFHYVDGVNADGFIYTGKSRIYCQEECESYDVFTKTVGQYTGLRDKNGTKIFEGDIIKVDNGTRTHCFVVKFGKFKPTMIYDYMEDEFGERPKEFCVGMYGKAITKGKDDVLITDRSDFFEIIGNIY